MRKTLVLIIICLFFLTSCSSGPPRSLQKTANEAMNTIFVELATEYEILSEMQMIDYYQISETEWCLAYEGGQTLHTATIWEKGKQRMAAG